MQLKSRVVLVAPMLAVTALCLTGGCAHRSNETRLCGQIWYTGPNSLAPDRLVTASSPTPAASAEPTEVLPSRLPAGTDGQPQYDKIERVFLLTEDCAAGVRAVVHAPGSHVVTLVRADDGGTVAFSLDTVGTPVTIEAYREGALVGSYPGS